MHTASMFSLKNSYDSDIVSLEGRTRSIRNSKTLSAIADEPTRQAWLTQPGPLEQKRCHFGTASGPEASS